MNRTAVLARRVAGPAFGVLFAGCAAFSVCWLLLGLGVAVVIDVPSATRWATSVIHSAHSAGWLVRVCAGLLAGGPKSEPLGQVSLDYGFSLLNLVLAGILLWLRRRDWTARLLALGMLGSAGGFNLQAHASVEAVQSMTGVDVAWWHVLLLHGVAGVAYVGALVLFPTGRIEVTGRARWTVRVLVLVGFLGAAALLSYSTAEAPHTITFVVFFGLLTPIAGVAAQLYRSRHASDAETRQQSRLLLWALLLAFLAALMLLLVALAVWALGTPRGSLSHSSQIVFWMFRGVFAVIPCALLAGLLRFRLWDIGRIFNRTLMYGTLLAGIGVVWVAVVVTADAAFDQSGRHNMAVQLLGVGAVALTADPLRRRAEHLIDRMTYGTRPAPYAVLARLAALSREAVGGIAAMPSLARVTAQGTGTAACSIAVYLDGGERVYRWPADFDERGASGVTAEVHYTGQAVGRIMVHYAASTGLGREQRGLLSDVAASAGLAVHNARLEVDLQQRLSELSNQAAELADSRLRIVAAQDGERRRLERNLHDGAQQQLVALHMGFGATARALVDGDLDSAAGMLDRLRPQLTSVAGQLCELARGVFPPALSEHGVLAALRAQTEALSQRVFFDVADGVDRVRLGPEIEAAVYFTCLEALQNAAKHAPGARSTVRLTHAKDRYQFAVLDDGPGFEAVQTTGGTAGGTGLQGMIDRMAAVGGELTVLSQPRCGTEVHGWAPARSPVQAPADTAPTPIMT